MDVVGGKSVVGRDGTLADGMYPLHLQELEAHTAMERVVTQGLMHMLDLQA